MEMILEYLKDGDRTKEHERSYMLRCMNVTRRYYSLKFPDMMFYNMDEVMDELSYIFVSHLFLSYLFRKLEITGNVKKAGIVVELAVIIADSMVDSNTDPELKPYYEKIRFDVHNLDITSDAFTEADEFLFPSIETEEHTVYNMVITKLDDNFSNNKWLTIFSHLIYDITCSTTLNIKNNDIINSFRDHVFGHEFYEVSGF